MNIPLLAMRGMIWHALDEWQMKNGKVVSEIINLPLSKKIVITKEIFDITKKELKTVLIEPIDHNEKLLDIIFEKAFRHYMEYINKIQR